MRNVMQGAAMALILALPAAIPVAAMAQSDNSSDQDGSGASAAAPAPPQPYFGAFDVEVGKGRLIKMRSPVANLFVADPGTATVHPASPDSMFVFGKKAGETDIVGTDQAGNRIAQYTVTVEPSSYNSDRLQGQAQTTAPNANVTAETEAGGVVLHGTVDSAEQADNLINQEKAISGQAVTNDLTVREPVQVELKVRIAEMSRTVTRELGVDWGSVGTTAIKIGKFALTASTASLVPSTGGTSPGGLGVIFPGGTFEGIIDALAEDNLAHILAEPTLTTLSGTQANFQVGGQFPVPVSSSNNEITVTFKNYGVLLSFIPTVFSDGRIALQVAPQISSLNTANAAVLSTANSNTSLVIPSLNIASASTTVILGSGQGMAIAGLLEDTTNLTGNGVPGLSEMPLLGALFRGDSSVREQEELVITVTPYIVNPVNDPGSLASPDDGWTPPNDLQRILLLRDNGTTTASASIPGDAGFMVQ